MHARAGRASIVAFLVATGFLQVGCDSGWFLYARNTSESEYLIRVSDGTLTELFSVPPGFEGHVDSNTGPYQGTLWLLKPDCAELQERRVAGPGSFVAVIGSGGSLQLDEIDGNGLEGPSAPRLRGVCGAA
jgi:hypothetical protein